MSHGKIWNFARERGLQWIGEPDPAPSSAPRLPYDAVLVDFRGLSGVGDSSQWWEFSAALDRVRTQARNGAFGLADKGISPGGEVFFFRSSLASSELSAADKAIESTRREIGYYESGRAGGQAQLQAGASSRDFSSTAVARDPAAQAANAADQAAAENIARTGSGLVSPGNVDTSLIDKGASDPNSALGRLAGGLQGLKDAMKLGRTCEYVLGPELCAQLDKLGRYARYVLIGGVVVGGFYVFGPALRNIGGRATKTNPKKKKRKKARRG